MVGMLNKFKGARSVRSAFIAIAVAVVASAYAQKPSEIRLDVNLKDADMMTATRMLMQRTGVQFIVEPSATTYQRVTLNLIDVTAEDAIRYICQSAGAYFRRDENGVYIISATPPKVPVAPATPAAPRERIVLPQDDPHPLACRARSPCPAPRDSRRAS